MADVYPYEKDPDRHPNSYVFFNVPGVARFDLDSAETLAKHCEALGMGPPESAKESELIYDALGSSGAPWEPGRWNKPEDGRMKVTTTAPNKNITAMTPEERAELKAALQAADDADRAGANQHEAGEG